ncbi:outer membrane protein [Aquabacter spiritensis]|uniref:Outer membrane immunogenic protein n=1 Tax=Aquabacter spiritensis TaxID=933073 RepID=A0A4R3M3R8_9HYPH|nr:outer membrane protein [Aquabacter spiritensis]TCT07682.1 outer membrane immunogenic protein [Aquabacter spiritensis]
MLKRALAGVSALALLGGAASAADLATRYPVKAPVVVPVFSWTGFYIGGNIGWGWLNNDVLYSPSYGIPATSINVGSGNGFLGGLQAGYNWQFANNVVLGVEADVEWTDLGSTSVLIAPAVGSVAGSLDVFGTIRARAGYAFDRVLPYITGGAAWGTSDYGNIGGVSLSQTTWGWTIGAGVEYAFTNNITAKLEYLYVDLIGKTYTIPSTLGSIETDNDMSVLKVGVNYKF